MTEEEVKLYGSLARIALGIVEDLVLSKRPDPEQVLMRKRSEIRDEISEGWGADLRARFPDGE